MSIDFLLFLLAAICFGLRAFGVPGRIDWTAAGFCLITLALWIV